MRLFSFFRKFIITSEHEEWTDMDQANFENFCTSATCRSLEKKYRNRIKDRRDNIVSFLKQGEPTQAIIFAAQEEEIADILLEFENTRKDVASKLKS